MAFTARTLGNNAAATMVSFGRVEAGSCLNTAWRAYGSPGSDKKARYGIALEAWNTATRKHFQDRNVPLGAPAYFSNVKGNWKGYPAGTDAGHIVIGNGRGPGGVASIDVAGPGTVTHTTIAAIQKKWPWLVYLGWTEDFLGHNIAGVGGAAPAGNTTPNTPAAPAAPTPEEDMFIRIQAPARGIALIGPGYYRQLTTDEEVNQSSLYISKHVTNNERGFDLAVSFALNGTGATSAKDHEIRNFLSAFSDATGKSLGELLGRPQAGAVTIDDKAAALIARNVKENLALSGNVTLTAK